MTQKTSDFYARDGQLPKRFEDPSSQKGYGAGMKQNLLYRTSNSTYGSRQPTVHDVPVSNF